jgi:hypothetical protein
MNSILTNIPLRARSHGFSALQPHPVHPTLRHVALDPRPRSFAKSSGILRNFARTALLALVLGGALGGCASDPPSTAAELACANVSSELSGGSGPVDCLRVYQANADALANAGRVTPLTGAR